MNHDRNTRFANNINVVVPEPNVETFRNSFMYYDNHFMELLLSHLEHATTHDSVKRMYKTEYF